MKLLIVCALTFFVQIVNADQFVPVYTDTSNNLSWSKAFTGHYSNGCLYEGKYYYPMTCTEVESGPNGDLQVKVDDSAAAQACKAIGARLPTQLEFESLIRNFDHTENSYGPRLTDNGMKAMQSIFGDMLGWFWSSTVSDITGNYYAYALNGFNGYGKPIRRTENGMYGTGLVRCVDKL
jgi:hypothetical protein